MVDVPFRIWFRSWICTISFLLIIGASFWSESTSESESELDGISHPFRPFAESSNNWCVFWVGIRLWIRVWTRRNWHHSNRLWSEFRSEPQVGIVTICKKWVPTETLAETLAEFCRGCRNSVGFRFGFRLLLGRKVLLGSFVFKNQFGCRC